MNMLDSICPNTIRVVFRDIFTGRVVRSKGRCKFNVYAINLSSAGRMYFHEGAREAEYHPNMMLFADSKQNRWFGRCSRKSGVTIYSSRPRLLFALN